MADVNLDIENVVRAGLEATYNGSLSVSNTYKVRNGGNIILHFKKSGAGSCTVTIQTPGTVDGLAVAERTVTVPASTGDVFCGPFQPKTYNDGNGDLNFTLSEITGLTVAVLRVA